MEITFTVEDMLRSIAELYTVEIAIPDLIENPYVIAPISLKNQQFYFHLYWNIRYQRCFLSVFKLVDGKREYYIKNIALINGIELSKNIKKTDWEGLLYFENIMNNLDDDYTINDIDEKFVLRFYASK